MQSSGVDAAIRELEGDVKKVQAVISMLKRLQAQRVIRSNGSAQSNRRLSASARRRISQAAKRRWATMRAAKSNSGKKAKS